MSTATLTSKGQLTVPKRIRDHLRIGAGDRVVFLVNEEGEIVVRSANSDVRDLRGLLRSPARRRAVTVDDMNAAIFKAHAARR